jgi:cell division protein ZapA
MATVNVQVNGNLYPVGCEDGQESHVHALAAQFDSQVQEVAKAVGRVGDLRLFLMAALMTADELSDLRARLAQAQSELARLQSDQARAEARAAQALDAAALRIEALAAKAG